MARIKIEDLPRDQKVSREEMRRIVGGMTMAKETSYIPPYLDQKTKQIYILLASIARGEKEMLEGINRNLL